MRERISSSLAAAAVAMIVVGLFAGCDKSDTKPAPTGAAPTVPIAPSVPDTSKDSAPTTAGAPDADVAPATPAGETPADSAPSGAEGAETGTGKN